MARGKFIVDRAILEHPALQDRRAPRWPRRAAFVDLVSLACWKPRMVSIGDKTVTLERGQLTHSTRFLAKRWGWTEAGVRRFFDRLKTDALIVAATDAGQYIIRINKYDEMQRLENVSDAGIDAPSVAEASQTRRKEKHREDLEDLSENDAADLGRERPSIVVSANNEVPKTKNLKIIKNKENSNRIFNLRESISERITANEAVDVLMSGFSVATTGFTPTSTQKNDLKNILASQPDVHSVEILRALENVVMPTNGTTKISNPVRWCAGVIENTANGGVHAAAE